MDGESAVWFKMKIRIHNEGVVEAVKKSSPPPAPPPAGDSGRPLDPPPAGDM